MTEIVDDKCPFSLIPLTLANMTHNYLIECPGNISVLYHLLCH